MGKKELEEPNGFLMEHFPVQRTQLNASEENFKVSRQKTTKNLFNRRLTSFFLNLRIPARLKKKTKQNKTKQKSKSIHVINQS